MRAIGVFLLFSYSVTSLFFGLIVKDFEPSSLLGKVADYSVSFDKARSELGFEPKILFETGMKETISWYVNNETWWKDLVAP